MAVMVNEAAHQLMVEQIRAVGRELARDAEKFVPDMEGITRFSIEIEFPIPSNSGIPEITTVVGAVSTEYIDDTLKLHGDYVAKKKEMANGQP